VTKEAEFAFKQAFAYCPFSPEAVFHFMDLLLSQPQPRVDDAILILETCHKLDPYNEQINEWINQLKQHRAGNAPAGEQIKQVFAQIQQQIAQGQTNAAAQTLEKLLQAAGSDPGVLMGVADAYLRLRDLARSEQVIVRLTQLQPDSSGTWYNLGAIQSYRGEIPQALASLKKSLDVNAKELAKDPKALNLRDHIFQDPNFAQLRETAEFKAAFGSKP
jgi:tetratricopeptide (TPR) repeat protein